MNNSNQKQKQKREKEKKQNSTEEDNLDSYASKNKSFNKTVLILIISFVLFSLYLQYQFEMKRRNFRLDDSDDDIDYYDVLGLNEGASAQQVKEAYKELAKVWHPDKNPGCDACTEKFKLIAKAKEIILQQASNEDNRSGKSLFASSPYLLTTNNYHSLVESSNDFWLICIYEGQIGNNFNKYIADSFDEVHGKYKNIIKFGVIDVLRQSNLLHFIPYKLKYFPNIFTYLNGQSDLMDNLENFSVTTLYKFIDNAFINKVNIYDSSLLNYYTNEYNSDPIKLGNKSISLYNIFSIKVFLINPSTHVSLVAKDFSLFYSNQVEVYQNDIESYNQSLKTFQSKGEYKVFIGFNKIFFDNTLKSYMSKKEIIKIPVHFPLQTDFQEKLQLSLGYIKPFIIKEIYKGNYLRHCVNKKIIENEEKQEERNEYTIINLCFLIINHSDDNSNPDFDKEIASSVSSLLLNKVNEVNEEKKQKEEIININFGFININNHSLISDLYKKINNNNKFDPTKKHIFIINDTNEKFTFKSFNTPDDIRQYIKDIQNSDFFHDINFSFKYFNEYGIKHIVDIFSEEKFFSIQKTIFNSFYSLMQPYYIITFIVLIIGNQYMVKLDGIKFFIFLIGISFLSGIVMNIVSYFLY